MLVTLFIHEFLESSVELELKVEANMNSGLRSKHMIHEKRNANEIIPADAEQGECPCFV